MFHQLKLRKQAKIDYQQARGTAHKSLLQKARHHLLQQQKAEQHVINAAQKEIKRLEAQQRQELEQVLTDYLVKERLTDVSGIGKARHADIVWRIYKGNLTDLQRAHQLPGIGQRTQGAINQWVRHYRKNFAKLLQENFPGKQQVILAYRNAVATQREKIDSAKKVSRTVQVKLDRIEPALNRLENVTVKDFYRVLKDPTASTPDLDHYIQGVFAEWEPIPDWFLKAISDAEVNWQPEEFMPKVDGKVSWQQKKNKQKETAVNLQPEKNKAEEMAASGSRPDLRTLLNKNRMAILLIGAFVVFCGCSCMFFVMIPKETDTDELPTQVSPAAITIEPSDTPTILPSAEATMTATPNREATATSPATETATVTPTETAVPQPQVRVIIGAANVRAEADGNAAIVDVVTADDVLPILDISEDGSWYLVELPEGGEGWIGSSVVEPIEDNEESP